MDYNDGPCIIDAEVVKEGNVFPMVPAGASLREMIIDPPRVESDENEENGEPS
jgi:acetolactate synthase-1/2/3 large subunit